MDKRFLFWSVSVFLAGAWWSATAATYYVDVNWTGTQSGTISAPYRTLGAAVTAANGANGNTILVADGSYASSSGSGLENFGANGLTITQGTTIQGGYAGWQSGTTFDWTTRVPRTTVVDLASANTRAFYRGGSGELNYAPTIDGLTIRNGNVTGDGGAIGGTTANHTGWTINNCLFENNRATGAGGAVYLRAEWNFSGAVTNSTFNGNSAGGRAGALYLDASGFSSPNRISVQGSAFNGNTAASDGGAIYAAIPNTSAPVEVRGCVITNNAAGSASRGGGIGVESSGTGTLNVYQTILMGNSAKYGAAVGAIANNRRTTVYMENNLIAKNTVTAGGSGAVYSQGNGTPTTYALDLAYCTVADNVGGGIQDFESGDIGYNSYGDLRVRDSIVTNNGVFGIAYTKSAYNHPPVLDYNDVYGQTSNYSGDAVGQATNSLSVDPAFLDPTNNNYQLPLVGSPARGAALNIGIYTDLLGTARPQWYFDLGAYQSIPEPAVSLLLLAAAPLLGARRRRC